MGLPQLHLYVSIVTDSSEVTEKACEFHKINSFSHTSPHSPLSSSKVPDVKCILLLGNLKNQMYFLDSDILDL